jgi:hypothetical protein
MDFAAWFEAFLDDHWYMFDATMFLPERYAIAEILAHVAEARGLIDVLVEIGIKPKEQEPRA